MSLKPKIGWQTFHKQDAQKQCQQTKKDVVWGDRYGSILTTSQKREERLTRKKSNGRTSEFDFSASCETKIFRRLIWINSTLPWMPSSKQTNPMEGI
ncbi:MAG: hypothetical protein ACOX6A_03965 [Atribacter sp.]|uniref:hypothetical protein n=1 Tax=Atribacter sp. TaxID=2847780 RepID=UPI003D9968F2